jgi:hypothetical protein
MIYLVENQGRAVHTWKSQYEPGQSGFHNQSPEGLPVGREGRSGPSGPDGDRRPGTRSGERERRP